MEASPSSRLPAELRNQIYEHVLAHSDYISFSVAEAPYAAECREYKLLALTTTCRQLRWECIPILYSINNFTIHSAPYDACYDGVLDRYPCEFELTTYVLRDWLAVIGA